MNNAIRKKLIILLFAVGFTLWLWGINFPYTGTYNANNNYLTLAAKNYIRYGFSTLKGLPTYYAGQTLPTPIPYYLHHPILIFPMSTVPFMIFGFYNWVVHVTNLLFLLGDIFLIYKIGEIVWSKKVGLWAAGLAMTFPMTTFFWKYIFFEQGSLFFNLCVYYFLLRYLKKPKTLYIGLIFLFTVFSGLIDWGVLYIFVPIMVLAAVLKKRVRFPITAYLLGTGISLGLFVALVYMMQGGFKELTQAVGVHAYTPILFKLHLWPIRLILISIVRLGIYFTPFSLFWLCVKERTGRLTLIFFFVFGIMNIFVLPTVTWENSYFLFYFIPFLAFSGALWLVRLEKKPFVVVLTVISIVIWSTLVNYFKIEQVRKQFWQYDSAASINKTLTPYEAIGVVNFAGDIFEQYFFHPTIPMEPTDIAQWQKGILYPKISNLVISGTLVTRRSPLPTDVRYKTSGQNTFVNWYRVIRDIFSVGQL